MDEHRRGALVAVLVVTALTAGCVGFLTGSEDLEFRANETYVGADALEETGYQEANNRTVTNRFNASVAGQERRITVTNYLYSYNRTLDVASAGNASVSTEQATSVTVVSTPAARVAGQSLNPLASLSDRALVERFLSSDQSNVRFESNRTVRSLGEDRTVSTYRAGSGNQSRSALLHVATISHEGDVIVVVASHPAAVDEQGRIDALIRGIEQAEA